MKFTLDHLLSFHFNILLFDKKIFIYDIYLINKLKIKLLNLFNDMLLYLEK